MIPLIPTLALAFFSFVSSSFVLLRIIVPVLPPHPLSKRVRPSEFGLPDYRSLSAADKSHVWLALCDVVALAMFLWEAMMEYRGSSTGFATSTDVTSSIRIWLALTLRQTCLLIVSVLTLAHVRMGKPVSFGERHWMLWAPAVVLVVTSTAIAGVLAGTGLPSFFFGVTAYSATLAIGSTVAFGCLVGTLYIIRRNLTALTEDADSWPPAKEPEEKPRPSFATEDVDALRDGSSWITSRAGSDHDSISAFSFSTHHTHVQHPAVASNPSIPAKSSFWFNPATPHNGNAHDSIPPVPPLPSPYRARALGDDHPDPFRRCESPTAHEARVRNGSSSSWLTSTSGTRPTAVSAWSYPTSRPESPELDAALASTQDLNSHLLRSRPNTPAMSSAQVLGGYGYTPSTGDTEKGFSTLSSTATKDVDLSLPRIISWLAGIWIPFALSSPYLLSVTSSHPEANKAISILIVLSVTISSPLLALNIVMRHGVPVPTGLFEMYKEPPSIVNRAPSPATTLPVFSTEYKRSGSMTVVEGRRSTDVWLAKGEAVDGKSRVGRALGMLAPSPKLSVLPPEEPIDEEPLTPPLPIQDAESLPPTVPPTPQSSNSAELGHTTRTRTQSKASSSARISESDSIAFTTKIMVAQRHYSTMAMTMVLPPSPVKPDEDVPTTPSADGSVMATGVAVSTPSAHQGHLRTRSASSWGSPRFPVSPPPSSPLPPTPPSVRYARLMSHKKSYSSGFDFGAVGHDDINEIDALSAGLLPLLVPGLKVGSDMRISHGEAIPSPHVEPATTSRTTKRGRRSVVKPTYEFGAIEGDFSSPEVHSTPYNRNNVRGRKTSAHKRNHFSLPSLALGKNGVHSLAAWTQSTAGALESKAQEYTTPSDGVDARRATVCLPSVAEDAALTTPPNADNHRNSIAVLLAALELPAPTDMEMNMNMLNLDGPLPSANSEVTLFDFEGIAPLAESTPPDYRRHSAASRASQRSKNARRSSIMYIKSDENAAPVRAAASSAANGRSDKSTEPQAQSRLREWSTRAVRPLVPKSSRFFQPTGTANPASASSSAVPPIPSTSPSTTHAAGLRPLSLLQDRSLNSQSTPVGTRGLSIKKKKQGAGENGGENAGRETGKARDSRRLDAENAPVAMPLAVKEKKHKRLRSLKLARSDTTRERAALRANEVLPDVVVRPPSEAYKMGW
ncbi:hypothetical protein OF83DRAFT_1179663 [Amylostereum chailletii]|nr:hypothetical protein OF83DRAFT_1179663 [Amylostereum chailletii]